MLTGKRFASIVKSLLGMKPSPAVKAPPAAEAAPATPAAEAAPAVPARPAFKYSDLFGEHGVMIGTSHLSDAEKQGAQLYFGYAERAEVALAVAQLYPGGDYFEFGSEGMGTFRNFLTAFDVCGCTARYPDTQFYAFDIFGDSRGATGDLEYFKGWHDSETDRMDQAERFVRNHGLFHDRCHLVRGFFEATLTPAFKAQLRSAGRSIGFAFLDCNITASYTTVFAFLEGLLLPRAAVYMDEYFCNDDVPLLFEAFCQRTGRRARFMRGAGAFGALFRVTPI